MSAINEATEITAHPGSALEVLRVFTRVGLTSFGGPIAHTGFFRTEFVERHRWLDETHYADVVALSQFLPGPASAHRLIRFLVEPLSPALCVGP
jgi:chromate transporter